MASPRREVFLHTLCLLCNRPSLAAQGRYSPTQSRLGQDTVGSLKGAEQRTCLGQLYNGEVLTLHCLRKPCIVGRNGLPLHLRESSRPWLLSGDSKGPWQQHKQCLISKQFLGPQTKLLEVCCAHLPFHADIDTAGNAHDGWQLLQARTGL